MSLPYVSIHPMSKKTVRKLERAAKLISEASEDLSEKVYFVAESDQLKRLALELGIDHTREPDWVLAQVGQMAKTNGHDLIAELLRIPSRMGKVTHSDYPPAWFDAIRWVKERVATEVAAWNERAGRGLENPS